MSIRIAMLIALVAGLVAACGGPSPTLAPTATPAEADLLASFDNDRMTMAYPAHWGFVEFPEWNSEQSWLMTFMSTEQLAAQCSGSDANSCGGAPIAQLQPDGVLLDWTYWSFPGFEFDPQAGELFDVDGRRATVQQQEADATCTAFGGDQLLIVIVEGESAGKWDQMSACVRGPDYDITGTLIAAMLKTVRWKD